MRAILIVVFLIGSIFVSSAEEFSQIISGNASLYTKVDTRGAHSAIDANGHQDYILYIENNKNQTRLDSIYNVRDFPVSNKTSSDNDTIAKNKSTIMRNNQDIPTNYYMISMDRPGGMYHLAEIRSNGSIISDNIIKSSDREASIEFNASTQGGTIEERVESIDGKKHRHYMIETQTNGSIDFYSSRLVDDTDLGKPDIPETEQLSNKLESAKLYGEIGRIEEQVAGQETIYRSPYGDIPLSNDSNFNSAKKILLKEEERPRFVRDSIAQIRKNDLEIKNPGANDVESIENKSMKNETEKSNYYLPMDIYKETIEANDTDPGSIHNDYKLIKTKDNIYLADNDTYRKYIYPILTMLSDKYNSAESLNVENRSMNDTELIITEQYIYTIKSEMYKQYIAPLLDVFCTRIDPQDPIDNENGNDEGAEVDDIGSFWDEGSTIEDNGLTYYLAPSVYKDEIEETLGIVHPNTTIDAYRLGRNIQRMVLANMGRKTNTEYFNSGQVTIPNSIRSQGNLTRSNINSTRTLSISYRDRRI